ncbi:MAG: acyltransferase [Chitinophagaceae bacterium]|nr:acyltransferase [Chitinophagaceae bacterium]
MRIAGLDILRSIAVLLVMTRHSDLEYNLIHQFGWLGVDLFFVISGFLVAGLLFAEYKKTGSMNIKRFLIRRGFKIYPSFYIFLLINLLADRLLNHATPPGSKLMAELFYVQNYFQGLLTHSWSLAVEEHFYLILAGSFFILMKFKMFKPNRRYILVLSLLFAAQVLLRSLTIWYQHGPSVSITKTHMRADGIIIGILIAYLYHFTQIAVKAHSFRLILIPVALLLILPGFVWWPGSLEMNLAGLPLVNLGFGLMVLLIAGRHQLQPSQNKYLHAAGFIGKHSYSIYLWHLLAGALVLRLFHFEVYTMTALYFTSALLIGLFFSLTVEKIFLKLRESQRVKNWCAAN